MICLYAENNLSTITFIFYTYICIPFLQITQSISRFFIFLVDPHHQLSAADQSSHCQPEWELDLPVSQFQELEYSSSIDDNEEVCSICLMKFLTEDTVNKLPKCGHVFHMECLEKWLDRCRFTCPLCRSSLLSVRSSSPCKTRASPPLSINLTAHDS
ncbi:hypothetical protein ABFX02_08G149100 [Erythranthe guttata]